MKIYNFDEIIDRRGTDCVKYDKLKVLFGNENLIPLWVADMDFKVGDFITEALKKHCEHGIFGYPMIPQDYFSTIKNWILSHHQWDIKEDWISFVSGVVKGIAYTVMHFTQPGDKIIIQPPVYHPFRIVPEMNHRKIVFNPLIEENGKYRMDLDGLQQILEKEDCKMLILSNPHNPVGITWDANTLKKLADICFKRNVLVISDEIHSDMALFGNKHIPFASVSEHAANNSITLMAPSKTFNIAGIVSSFAIIPNDKLRHNFFEFLHGGEFNQGNLFAYIATEAAYKHGEDWMKQMLNYIEENIFFIENYIRKNISEITVVRPEASFLIWLDCRKLDLSQKELSSLFVDKAGLALNDGEMFGIEGKGFMRMNVGCSRLILKKALENLRKAVSSRITTNKR
ncbi:MAG: pyridoxal phosphate-dependent aminotransferase [Dysgonamonadaceae bacterium]|jgi:cystathionine beta-lyase|nr:pyridoxal phosphate-dependent aminotransferase [Dysgonamonadaceae bacterium]